MDENCPICAGDGWVCENHPDKPWNGGDGDCGDGKPCGGAGQLCACNSPDPAPPPPDEDLAPSSGAPADG